MPEAFKDKAAAEMKALPEQVKVKIEQRFTDLSSLTDDVAVRMAKDIEFPEALIAAVNEKDPELANEIEKTISAKPEEKPKEETGEEKKPEVEAETAVKTGAGVSPQGPAVVASVEETISVGDTVEITIETGATITEEGADVLASGELSYDGALYLNVYRDPLTGTKAAGAASYYFTLAEGEQAGVYGGPSVEAGESMEGDWYIIVAAPVAVEGENFSVEVAPQVIAGEGWASFGGSVSGEYHLSDNFSVNLNVYTEDVTAAKETTTATAGMKVKFK